MKMYYDLESQVDMKGLEDLHFKICIGMSKSKKFPTTRIVPHYEMSGQWREAVDFKNLESNRILNIADEAVPILNEKEFEIYNELSYDEKRFFMEMYSEGYRDGDHVPLTYNNPKLGKEPSAYYAAFYKEHNLPSVNMKHFSELMDWILYKTPFIHLGRIMIFKTSHYLHTDMHFDRKDDWNDGRHHFIWFNPFGMKKFFLVDGYEKIYIKSKAIFFDMSYIHGSDPTPFSTYALRIDGQLSEEFCNANDILWKKRK